jgi:hypothetical protein
MASKQGNQFSSRLLMGVALSSAGMMAFEINLTRIFSITHPLFK